ncbi:MAG: hypothetical protein U0807_12160 [Candidatus Binatia bacterium]
MNAQPADAFDAALRVADALDRAGVPYALGGALAYGQYGIPRATNDVDVNVFVTPPELGPTVTALQTLGIALDIVTAQQAAEREGLFVTRFGDFRLDVFTPSIDFSWEALRTRVRHHLEGRDVWFLSAEALAVFKLLFFRGKDVVDLERLVAVSGDSLDAGYVRTQLVRMMGPDDPRVATWDRLWQEHRPR